MPSQSNFQLSGLHITENKFSAVPPGSLSIADNIVIDYKSVGQSRRGYTKEATAAARLDKLDFYTNVLHAFGNGILYRLNAGVLTAYSGTVTPPTGFKNRTLEQNNAFYFTTNEGIKKIFAVGGAIRNAGVPRALSGIASVTVNKGFTSADVNITDDRIQITNHRYNTGLKIQFATTGTLPTGVVVSTDYYIGKFDNNNVEIYPTLADAQAGTNKVNLTAAGSGSSTIVVQDQGFLTAANYCAYRILYGYKDTNEYLFRGAPSGRMEVQNTDPGLRPCLISFQIPAGIQAGDFVQIYRTAQSTGIPNDEMFMVTEIPITSANISAGSIFYLDSVADDSLGEALYTNQSQQGILSANDLPPIAVDIANYKGYQLYANTRRREKILFQLNEVPELDQTITIGAEVYTAKATENIGDGHFERFTAGTRSENIKNTANSLMRVINGDSASYYAYYLSISEPQGILLVEGRSNATAAFTLTTTTQAITPVPGSGGILSDSEDRVNRVCVSKPSQPDAVPEAQFIELGRNDKPIQRIIPLRDSIFVFKDDGVFRIVGETFETFRISVFDSTIKIIGAETANVLDNSIFVFTDSGVTVINDNGSAPVGNPIDSEIVDVSKNANFKGNAFSLVDEPERKYILFYPAGAGDIQATTALVYNFYTNAWTRWTLSKTAGAYNDKIYLAGIDEYSNNYLYSERKNYSLLDYVDNSFEAFVIAEDRDNFLLQLDTAAFTQIAEGDQITQGQSVATVESIFAGTYQVRVRFLTETPFKINRTFVPGDVTGDNIDLPAHEYTTGDFYQLSTTDTLPDPLIPATNYYVIVIDPDTIQFAASFSDAIAGTPITLLDAGIGTHTIESGVAVVESPIQVNVAWNPLFADNPGIVKHFQDCSYIFGNSTFNRAVAFFKTGFSKIDENVPLETVSTGAPWGRFPWGAVPWGDTTDKEQIIRTYVPLEKRRASWIYVGIRIAQPRANVQIKGVNVVMEEVTENFR